MVEATVVAVVAFAHPETGTWRQGDRRVLPVDVAVPLVDVGYVEPVWDAPPPAQAGKMTFDPGLVETTIYNSVGRGPTDDNAHAPAPDPGTDLGRNRAGRRPGRD